jgi:hypothetical protein
MSKLDQRREEFFRYVWDHTADPFVIGYEARAPLTDEELQWLQQVYQYCQADVEIATPSLKELLVNNGASLIPIAEPEFIIAPLLQVPPASRGEPREARLLVPPAGRGNLKEGVVNYTCFYGLWSRDWYNNTVASGEWLDTQQNHQRPESESWKGLRAK